MKEYITPDMKLIRFHVNDVLAAYGGGFNPDAEEGNGWNAGPDQSTGFEIG